MNGERGGRLAGVGGSGPTGNGRAKRLAEGSGGLGRPRSRGTENCENDHSHRRSSVFIICLPLCLHFFFFRTIVLFIFWPAFTSPSFFSSCSSSFSGRPSFSFIVLIIGLSVCSLFPHATFLLVLLVFFLILFGDMNEKRMDAIFPQGPATWPISISFVKLHLPFPSLCPVSDGGSCPM